MKYTVRELAEMSGLGIWNIDAAIKKGELKSNRVGIIYLVDKADFVEWWKTHPKKRRSKNAKT